MGIHKCGSESNLPTFNDNSVENSASNANNNNEDIENDPRETPTDIISPSEANSLTAVA